METDTAKRPMKMTGGLLQAAAFMMETPGSRKLLYNVATKQLGLHQLQALAIPGDVPMHHPTHLGRTADDD